ncbi:Hypothetical protein GSB_152916, partial [Giardia duodenalis]
VEEPALQERDAPQPPPRALAARQGRRTVSRCAACDKQERAVKERHGSVLDHEARHDRPCLYLRLSGSSVRSWRSDAQPPPTRTRSRTPGHRQVQDHRRGVTLPRQMDHYYNEKLRKYRDGTLPIIYGTDGSLHPVQVAPRRAPCGR